MVKVNNIEVKEPQHKVDFEHDVVTISNHRITYTSKHYYVALYKPVEYLSDLKDPRGRRLARDLIDVDASLFPVGRLDYNSEGLMIFTNDGGFANTVMHPRYGVEKEYLAKFKGNLGENDMERMREGLSIDGLVYKVKEIRHLKSASTNQWYKVIVEEGRNRMIRKIGDEVNHPVLKLKRVRIGSIKLGSLKPGEYRFLRDYEIKTLDNDI